LRSRTEGGFIARMGCPRSEVLHFILSAATVTVAAALGACSAGGRLAPATTAAVATVTAPDEPAAKVPFADPALASWMGARLPRGGEVVPRPDGTVAIQHAVQENENVDTVAESYIELTHFYRADDLARAIRDDNKLGPDQTPERGAHLSIPDVIDAIPAEPSEGRLGWPEDKVMRGVHVRGIVAVGKNFARLLDQMAARGMNLIVLDVKDADGRLTFPSSVPLANEVGAIQSPSMRHLSRTIQFAHEHGIRVAMRIVCFQDDVLSRARRDLAVQSIWGKPMRIGWLDPANDVVQRYLIDLAQEAMDAGADEIQLDYVRYPVEKIQSADFRLKELKLTKPEVIRDFVRRVHEVVQPRGVPLTVDVFGIVAEGVRQDLENLGQDPGLLSRECEVISPMVYPSHYPKGFMGFAEPGDHPELVRVGVSRLLALIHRSHPGAKTLVRPWIQGMPYHAPSFGPQYIAEELGHAKRAGAAGWMVWNPSQNFADTWQAVAPLPTEDRVANR
jgi:hypothetical protein